MGCKSSKDVEVNESTQPVVNTLKINDELDQVSPDINLRGLVSKFAWQKNNSPSSKDIKKFIKELEKLLKSGANPNQLIKKGPPTILLSRDLILCLKKIHDINKQDKLIKILVTDGKLDINTVFIDTLELQRLDRPV